METPPVHVLPSALATDDALARLAAFHDGQAVLTEGDVSKALGLTPTASRAVVKRLRTEGLLETWVIGKTRHLILSNQAALRLALYLASPSSEDLDPTRLRWVRARTTPRFRRRPAED
jgi:hypothetical protein